MCKINGKKLAEIRRENGLTQAQLAKKMGVSEATIGFYENGRTNPPDENVDKICVILKINKGDIEIQDVGYSFTDQRSKVVNNVRKRKGFIRYLTPEQTEEWISNERKLSAEEEEAEIKNALKSSFGIGNKKYILIYPELIHIPEWQRNTDMAKAEEISQNFNEDKFDPIKGYLKNGFCVDVADGAHRVVACVNTNKDKKKEDRMKVLVEILPCDEHDAVITFLGQQSGRKPMTVSDTYRAGVKANIQEYIDFKHLFEEENIQITVEKNKLDNPVGKITPSSTALRMVERDKEVLIKIINLIKNLDWCGSEKNVFVMRNFFVLKKLYAQFGEDAVNAKLMENCKGAVYFESKVAPIKSNAELFDMLSAEINK